MANRQINGGFSDKTKINKWHLASSIEEEYYILLGAFVLPLTFKREKGKRKQSVRKDPKLD